MLRSALLLVRSALPAVLVLAVSATVLSNLMMEEGDDPAADRLGSIPSLEPLRKAQPIAGAGSAIQQVALFDPARRPETVSGSIDDLRSGPQPSVAPVAIAGVMLSGGIRKAMLSLGGAAPAWSGVGEERGGWRVAVVDEEGAVLERNGQSLTLKVADRYKQRGKAQAGAAMPSTGSEPVETPPDAGLTPPPDVPPIDP